MNQKIAINKVILAILLCFAPMLASAQSVIAEGPTYYLPKTALKVTLLVEKTTLTPGRFADYSTKFLNTRKNVVDPSETYRIINVKMETIGIPDSSKFYAVRMGSRQNVNKVYISQDGVLLSVNAEPKVQPEETHFRPSPRPLPIDPSEYMTDEMLSAGSNAKMAQLCAQEIYEIRNSRNDLVRGTANVVPKDGAQLNLMLANLQMQETGLTELFEGTTTRDTTEQVVFFCPEKNVTGRSVLFRFSELYGLVRADDLSGVPYYITISNIRKPAGTESAVYSRKTDAGININVPGRAHVTVTQNDKTLIEKDFSFAQFGHTENLSSDLFTRKNFITFEINQATGGVVGMTSKETSY